MKRPAFALAIAVLFSVLAACATVPNEQPTPLQIAERVCPSIIAVGEVLTVPGAVDPSVADDLESAAPIVLAACSNGVQFPDLEALHDKAIPTLIRLVQLAPIDPAQKQALTLGIAVARAALYPVLHQ